MHLHKPNNLLESDVKDALDYDPCSTRAGSSSRRATGW